MTVRQGPGRDLGVVPAVHSGSSNLHELAGSEGWPKGEKLWVYPPPPQ